MSEYGRRYDGKPFSEGDYNIISGGGGDPDNDGVVTEQEWSDWMLSKGATPGYEDEYAKRIQEVAAALGNSAPAETRSKPDPVEYTRSQPDPVVASMQSEKKLTPLFNPADLKYSSPNRNYMDLTFDNPMKVRPQWDSPEDGVILNDEALELEFELYGEWNNRVMAKASELAKQRYRETKEQFEQTLRDADVGVYGMYITQLSNDYARGTSVVVNPLGNTVADYITDSDGTVRSLTLADRMMAARSAYPATAAMLDGIFGDAAELPFDKFEKIYETFNNIPKEQTRSVIIEKYREQLKAEALGDTPDYQDKPADKDGDGTISDAELLTWRPSDGRFGKGHGGINLSQKGVEYLEGEGVPVQDGGVIAEADFAGWAAANDKYGVGVRREAWDGGYDADGSGVISAEELAAYEVDKAAADEAAKPLTNSQVAQLLRGQKYDISEGIVEDLSDYEFDVTNERSLANPDWGDHVDYDQNSKTNNLGRTYELVTSDPYSSGELTVDTNGDGVPDAEAPLDPQRQYQLQKQYEDYRDGVIDEAQKRRQEDINERLPIENANFDGKSEQEILDYIDDRHRNEEELEALAAAAGYELTDADRAELVGNLNNADWDEETNQSIITRTQEQIDYDEDTGLLADLDNLVVTEEELEDYAKIHGYKLSDADRRKYVGQTNRGEDTQVEKILSTLS